MSKPRIRTAPRNPATTTSFTGIAFACVLVAAPHATTADPASLPPLGARGVALGGAFSALVDDATAIYWNPAGLTHITHQEFVGTYANLFAADIRDNQIAYALPLTTRHVVAADWYHSGFDDDALSFGENRFDLAYAFRFGPWLSLGATGKYLRRDLSLDGERVEPAVGSGWGMDLGAQASPRAGVRLGIMLQDVFDTRLEADDGSSDVAFARNVRLGVAWMFRDRLSAALDVDDRWHLGVEGRVVKGLVLRAGIQDDLDTDEGAAWSGGVGIELGPVRFDYAREDHPVLAATNHYTLSFAFNFNPALVRIEEVEVSELYASLHKSYAQHPFGSAKLRNLRDEPLEVRLRIDVPGYMEQPSEQTVVLRPKAVQDVPFTAVFSDGIMAAASDRPVQVVVAADYRSLRLPRTETAAARTVAYGPGAINWGLGVEQAAAYVTPRDPAVAEFARGVVRLADAQALELFGNRNVAQAAAMFEALEVLGLAYVADPNNPYALMSTTPQAVDTVHYPRTTLASRVGDCDDTSVLMAALLGNIGIATQLVDVPEHLFVLVDTGVRASQRTLLGVPDELTVADRGRIWLPLETTAIGRGFAHAWQEGARRYNEYETRGRLARVDVRAASTRYPAAEPTDASPGTSIDAALLGDRLRREAQEVAVWRARYAQERFAGVSQTVAPSVHAWNQVAYVYYRAGRWDAARERLEAILRDDSGAAMALNNLAVLAAARGDLPEALTRARAAAAADAADGGILLNLGLLERWGGDDVAAQTALHRGLTLAGGAEAAASLLGAPAAPAAGATQRARAAAPEIRGVLQELEASRTTGFAFGSRLGDVDREILYWKRSRP